MTNTNGPIQWTDVTWSPVVGCTHVSTGCDHCYAATLHNRRYLAWKRGNFPNAPAQYHLPFKYVQLLPERLSDPLHWRKPRHVFVNSMSDLFHESVPDKFILQVFTVMRRASQHTFQVLTKRPERMSQFMQWLAWRSPTTEERANGVIGWQAYLHGEQDGGARPLPNVWLGVSVEHQAAADERIPLLLETPAAVRFLSCEPLLGPLNLTRWLHCCPSCGAPRPDRIADSCLYCQSYADARGVDWVIIGGESGKFARLMKLDWAVSLLAQCRAAQVPVFMKQLGAVQATTMNLRDSHGGTMADWPEHLRMREYPQSGGDA